ncbi:MAG TPA: hypothetical protein VGB70_01015 [Allosphingosinicella sp.]|jgi:hypothetical protein
MISSVLAMALAAAAPGSSPDALARARKAYSACLTGFMKKSLKDKMEVDAFGTALGPACAAQEQAFRTAVISVDTAAGIKRAAAEENAGMEVTDMVANAKEMFEVYKTSNTLPDG